MVIPLQHYRTRGHVVSLGQHAHILADYTAHLRAGNARARTIRFRTYHAEQLLALAPIHAVTTADLEQWVAPPNTDYAAETLRSRRASARRFYGWLHATDRIDHNPADALPRIRVYVTPPRVAPDASIAAALCGASSRDRALILLARYACLRLSEATMLHSSHLEGDALRIHGKGGKTRLIYPHTDVLHALDVLEHEQGYGFYFPGETGPHLHPQSVSKIIRRLTGWNAHSLRHAGATAAYRATKDLRAVQLMLGHASLATTQRYLSVGDDALRRAGAAVELQPELRLAA